MRGAQPSAFIPDDLTSLLSHPDQSDAGIVKPQNTLGFGNQTYCADKSGYNRALGVFMTFQIPLQMILNAPLRNFLAQA